MTRTSILAIAGALYLGPGTAGAQLVSLVDPDGTVDWNRYYTAGESDRILSEFHQLHPELTELESIGESYLGAPLMVITITNEATGPASSKPALYVDGGIHAGELTGSAVALHLVGRLLTGYGKDGRITELLDRRAFYVRPKFNPDGSDLVLTQDQRLRSSVHPVDEDGDGLADEDPAQDLDGDGWITRIRIPDPEGPFYADPSDPRILRPVEGTPPQGARRYRTESEGVDDDGDGRIDEDGFGGIDMNRNFPRNWERVHLQPGAGAYPLSEPETFATVRFIEAHRNVVGIVHGHTSGGFVYRLPSASDPSRFPADDLALIEHLGQEYTRSTGRPVEPSSTHPTDHRYGTLISWGYWDMGVIGWVPEYSPGPEAWVTDYDGDGSIGPEEEMRFDDEVLDGRYFSPWTPYRHPQLGDVEIGGWHRTFWGQNPPAEYLEDETSAQLHWILYLAEQSPLLTVSEPRVTALGEGRFRVEATVTNVGFLPTSLTGRGAVGRQDRGVVRDQVVSPPVASLVVEGAELVDGTARWVLPHLGGRAPFLEVGPDAVTAAWTVRVVDREAVVRVEASAEKGGRAASRPVALERRRP